MLMKTDDHSYLCCVGLDRILDWRPDDLIIIGDADEIPDRNTLRGLTMVEESVFQGRHRLLQHIYYYDILSQVNGPVTREDGSQSLAPLVWNFSYVINYATYILQPGSLNDYRVYHNDVTAGILLILMIEFVSKFA